MSDALAQAIKRGRLTPRHVRELIAYDAAQIGLTYEDAIDRARRGELSETLYGRDIEMLLLLLEG